MNYAPEIAGVGRVNGDIAEHLVMRGMEVDVITTPPHYPGWVVQPGYRRGYSVEDLNGVIVRRCPLFLRRPMQGFARVLAPLSFALSSAPLAFWHILKKAPDIVLCVEPTLFGVPASVLAARLRRARTVLHVQDLEVDAAFAVGHLSEIPVLRRMAYAYERWALRRFDAVITISDVMAQRLREKGVDEGRISVIRNWVDLEHLHPLPERNEYRARIGLDGSTAPIALYSGNIGMKQGLPVLLEAAASLQGRSPLMLLIAGEGPAKQGLIDRYGTLGNVRFLPFQPYEHLNAFMNVADIHVLPQEKGMADLVLPSKLGGMLATGGTLIVTADPDTEMAAFLGDAAMIVPPGDADALAEALRLAAEQRERPPQGREERLALAQTLSRDRGLERFFSALLGTADAGLRQASTQLKELG